MLSKKEHQPRRREDPRFYVAEATVKQWQFNQFLYVLVGRPWTWTNKLAWSDAEWVEYAESNSLRTFPAYYDGSPAGYFELSRSPENEVELAAFGLAQKFIGRGFGGPLLSMAIEKSWEMEPSRIWLHTCELDHPHALKNYLARGFSVYRVEQE